MSYPGCRCPDGLYLQGGRCVNASKCVCLWDGQTLQPGQTISRDQCTTWWQTHSFISYFSLWKRAWFSYAKTCFSLFVCYYWLVLKKTMHIFCPRSVCRDGQVTCDSSGCVATCRWSAWSSWSPCDVTCGLGLQQRYRWASSQIIISASF